MYEKYRIKGKPVYWHIDIVRSETIREYTQLPQTLHLIRRWWGIPPLIILLRNPYPYFHMHAGTLTRGIIGTLGVFVAFVAGNINQYEKWF